MKTSRTVYLIRNRPPTTEAERRAALGSLGNEHPVWCALQDELDAAFAGTAGAATGRNLTPDERAWEAGYGAAIADLRSRLETLRGTQ